MAQHITIQKQLEGLTVRISQYKETQQIKLWHQWNRLSPEAQQTIRQDWEDYYAKCHKSPLGENYAAQTAALHRGDLEEVKGRAAVAKELWEMGLTVKKPTSFPIDPTVFSYSSMIYRYRTTVYEYGQLQLKQRMGEVEL